MADKDTVAAIKQRDAERPGRLVDLVRGEGGLEAGLRFLVEDYRKTAELYATAQLRGGKTLQQECNTTAARLALLLRGVEQAEKATPPQPEAVERPCPNHPAPTVPAAPGSDVCTACERASAIGDPAKREQARERAARLDAFVQERAAARGDLLAEMRRNVTEIGDLYVIDYLKGSDVDKPLFELSDPPALQRDAAHCPECGETADRVTACDNPWHGAAWSLSDPTPPAPEVPAYPVTHTVMGMGQHGASVVPVLDEPWSVPGARTSWGQLQGVMDGTPLADLGLPEHLSHSQVETLNECGTKYLLQRSETLGVVQVPQWALIGGTAFHAAAEWFERLVLEVKTPQFVADRLKVAGGTGEIWRKTFGATVVEVAIANPLVPQEQWRAARKGAEGYTWWLVNGENMLQDYVAGRMVELQGPSPYRRVRYGMSGENMHAQEPMIEHESSMKVGAVEFKVILDQVWDITADEGPMRPGDLLIDDLKSGRTLPVETGQLEEYALWLSQQVSINVGQGGPSRRVWGRFYDARKGAYTEPVDLLERADWRRFEFEVAAADRTKRAGVFAPRPSPFCGGCSVKHACPVFAA